MTRWAIADTGPLVAFLDRRERHHAWAVEQMPKLKAPLLVCEPVLTEAMFLLGLQYLPQARARADRHARAGPTLINRHVRTQ